MRIKRSVALLAASLVAASLSIFAIASPAAARPHDCSLRATLNRVGAGVSGSGYVSCARSEHYAIRIYVFREEAFDSSVAHAYKGYYDTGNSLTTLEPCSDVQTSKTYHAKAILYDTRFGPPIEVKEAKSSSAWGHC
jgi:hypothetical protein